MRRPTLELVRGCGFVVLLASGFTILAFSDAGIHSGWGYLVVALVGDAGALAGMAAWVRMDWARVPEPAVLSPPGGPGAPPAPSSPPCPRCGRPTEFAVRFGRYWCPVDRAYV